MSTGSENNNKKSQNYQNWVASASVFHKKISKNINIFLK